MLVVVLVASCLPECCYVNLVQKKLYHIIIAHSFYSVSKTSKTLHFLYDWMTYGDSKSLRMSCDNDASIGAIPHTSLYVLIKSFCMTLNFYWTHFICLTNG